MEVFVVQGYQGVEGDHEKLALTDGLLASVLCEARVCCSGWPAVLVGDRDADSVVIISLTEGLSGGRWVD